ncbi:MAG TPA: aromatic ring-hydroxylating dioxygenase subunit alpha [Nitrososphaerales archaeon]|nr:aromatic ring-hydroxylating dioxygenase subunit alpha [Nitrososphaerales archaeon]
MIEDSVLLNDWHVVARSSDIPEGDLRKARLLGEDLVVWRVGGVAHVWQDLCMHRGSRLTLGHVEGERLVCAYHGWSYDAEGQCVGFPAHPDQKPPPTAHTKVYRAREMYGYVWAALGDPQADVPPLPEWDDPSFRKIVCRPFTYRASAPRAVENFLDVGHFPFVHEGLLGDKDHAAIEDYEVDSDPGGILARNVKVWQPDPDGTGVGKYVNYTYGTRRPFTAYFSKTSNGQTYMIQLNVTPVDEFESIAWMCIAMNYGQEIPEEDLKSFQEKIVGQDIPVVESQRPERLPLDLQAELHLRSDRIAVAYRKWLKQLGLTFGTS